MTRDHPRACGEHVTVPQDAILTAGSSPRLRGTLVAYADFAAEHGIIPALAGNTCRPATRRHRSWDHPRACGEHRDRRPLLEHVRGSSPRLRGTRRYSLAGRLQHGIIPALAGNTCSPANHAGASRDHPRACGEHYCFRGAWEPYQGSSPRLRGTRSALAAAPSR